MIQNLSFKRRLIYLVLIDYSRIVSYLSLPQNIAEKSKCKYSNENGQFAN